MRRHGSQILFFITVPSSTENVSVLSVKGNNLDFIYVLVIIM